ncbi:FAD binding domain-containing protein [Pseudahrensia aquimaris]|uniref:FAD binding domain-containing protein n=1 Tax=Pseudahrensia aquimaris TaxID=744461 RepID=A0ABW3F8R5_9HYPH
MIAVETFPNAQEASAALRNDAVYLAGGTIVMNAVNYGRLSGERIVRATDPALARITRSGDRIEIGAAVTMAEVISSPDVALLAPAARAVGGPAIRNMATVGGNLFAHHPYGDFAVALLALDAKVQIAGGGEQELEAFLVGRDSFRGLVTGVTIAQPSGVDFRFRKVTRIKPKGVSIMSIAACLNQSAGRLSSPRIAFGAMGTTPLRAKNVERALEGVSLDAMSIKPALDALRSDFQPPDDPIASGWYRSEVAPVHLRRLLLKEEG